MTSIDTYQYKALIKKLAQTKLKSHQKQGNSPSLQFTNHAQQSTPRIKHIPLFKFYVPLFKFHVRLIEEHIPNIQQHIPDIKKHPLPHQTPTLLPLQSMNNKSKIHDEDTLARMIRWCAYRERSQFETEQKLQTFSLSPSDKKNIMQYLSQRGYVDELRFARAFVRGKFRQNQWGRLKIQAALRSQHIDSDIIKKALGTIDEADYERLIRKLAVAKAKTLKEAANSYENKAKIFRYLSAKGFTPNEIRKTTEQLFSK